MTGTIGIDVGGTTLSAARLDGQTLHTVRRRPSPQSRLVAEIADLAVDVGLGGVDGVGVAIAGLVDRADGRLIWAPNLPVRDLAIRAELAERLSLPVVVDNDANCAGLAEARIGAGAGYRHVVTLTLGTGIGGALTIDGEIYHGRGLAGEFGHLAVASDGPACGCGQVGCWETLASGRRLDAQARMEVTISPRGAVADAADGLPPTARHLELAARAGDEGAGRAIAETGRWLGRGLAAVVAFVDPDVIVIGGGITPMLDLLLDTARPELQAKLAGADVREPTPLLAAQFGADAGVVGAALAAQEAA